MGTYADRMKMLAHVRKGQDHRETSLHHECAACLSKAADMRVEEISGVLIAYVCNDCWNAVKPDIEHDERPAQENK